MKNTELFSVTRPANTPSQGEIGSSVTALAPSNLLKALVQATPTAVLSLETAASEKPRPGLLTLRFAPASPRTQQSLLPSPAACYRDCSLWWVCCVPPYQRDLQVGFPPQRSTVGLLGCAATSTVVSPLQLNSEKTLWLFAQGATGRTELYDHRLKILPGSLDASL